MPTENKIRQNKTHWNCEKNTGAVWWKCLNSNRRQSTNTDQHWKAAFLCVDLFWQSEERFSAANTPPSMCLSRVNLDMVEFTRRNAEATSAYFLKYVRFYGIDSLCDGTVLWVKQTLNLKKKIKKYVPRQYFDGVFYNTVDIILSTTIWQLSADEGAVTECCCSMLLSGGRAVSQQLWIRFQLLKLKRSEPSRHGGEPSPV